MFAVRKLAMTELIGRDAIYGFGIGNMEVFSWFAITKRLEGHKILL